MTFFKIFFHKVLLTTVLRNEAAKIKYKTIIDKNSVSVATDSAFKFSSSAFIGTV